MATATLPVDSDIKLHPDLRETPPRPQVDVMSRHSMIEWLFFRTTATREQLRTFPDRRLRRLIRRLSF